MLLGTSTSATTILAAVGGISSDTFTSVYGWVIVAIGIPLGFVVVRYLISLFKHGVGNSGSDTDQIRKTAGDYSDTDQIRKTAGDYSETQGEISRQFPLMGDFKE